MTLGTGFGERACHAVDEGVAFSDAKGIVCQCNSQLCLHIEAETRASFKDQAYFCHIVIMENRTYFDAAVTAKLVQLMQVDLVRVSTPHCVCLSEFNATIACLACELSAEWIANPPEITDDADRDALVHALTLLRSSCTNDV